MKTVILENENLLIEIVPEKGAKISKLFFKETNFECLFQNKNEKFISSNVYDSFEKSEACGIDFAFPTIDECSVKINNKEILYPDHGEVWALKFDYVKKNNQIELTSESKILPLTYKIKYTLEKNSLFIKFSVTNNEKYNIPCLFAFHGLFNIKNNMQLFFPDDSLEVENVHQNENLGKVGNIYNFPLDKNINRNFTYPLLNKGLSCEKFYIRNKINDNKCGYLYKSENTKVTINFNSKELPFIGYWGTYGEFRGDYNCALEPSSSYYDSVLIAEKNNTQKILTPNEIWQLDFEIILNKLF